MDGFAYWILAMGDRVGIKKSQKCELSAVFCGPLLSERNLRNMKRFAAEYPHFPFLQVSLAKLEGLPIWQVPLAELKNENREFVQVPLTLM